MAEGFRRRSPADFARFVIYAYSAVAEVTDRLEDGLANDYWIESDTREAASLIRRLNRGLTRLHAYLLSQEATDNAARIRGRKQRPQPIPPRTRDRDDAKTTPPQSELPDPRESPKRHE